MADDSDYTYFNVLEARRAAQMIARSSGIKDDARIDHLASNVGRTVSQAGAISRGDIQKLVSETLNNI